MRVLIVNKHVADTIGGSETQCDAIATRLHHIGHEVTYAACDPIRASYDAAYSVLPLHGPMPQAYRHAIADVKPDVVYWRYNKRHLLRCVLASRARRIPFVFAVSHINDVRVFAAKAVWNASLPFGLRLARSGRWLRAAASGALNAVAFRFVDGVVLQHGAQDSRLITSPKRIIYSSHQVAQADEAFEVPAGRFVLWIGSVKRSKNPEGFIQLARELRHLSVKFVMIGDLQDASYRSLLNASVTELDNFAYLGLQPRSRVTALVSACLLVVHTGAPEGFPNVFIQAWSHGKPVVSLRVDPDELLESGGLGRCSVTSAGLRNDVERLVADDVERSVIGTRAAAFARERFDPAANVDALCSFMDELVTRRPHVPQSWPNR